MNVTTEREVHETFTSSSWATNLSTNMNTDNTPLSQSLEKRKRQTRPCEKGLSGVGEWKEWNEPVPKSLPLVQTLFWNLQLTFFGEPS